MNGPEFPLLRGEHFEIPEVLADKAEKRWQEQKMGGNAVSKPVALGLVMKDEGSANLKELLSGNSDTLSMQSIVSGLNDWSKEKFLYGFGEVILGSVLHALEQGVFGWDDKVFVDNLNETVKGTPIPQAKLTDIKAALRRHQQKDGSRLRTSQEQTQIIRSILSERSEKRDMTFLSFIQRSSYQRALLPQAVYVFIYELQPLAGEALSAILPTYKEILMRLSPD
ncbi:MAG: hypothetical protein HY425_01820 [Candidatus Levybacteria bacterium]|nr:hypothetical protein [Candidatus Levybacteria bacterium]